MKVANFQGCQQNTGFSSGERRELLTWNQPPATLAFRNGGNMRIRKLRKTKKTILLEDIKLQYCTISTVKSAKITVMYKQGVLYKKTLRLYMYRTAHKKKDGS